MEDALCMTVKEIECSQAITNENTTSCKRSAIFILLTFDLPIFFSPCSGLVVSGYSKTKIDKSLKKKMSYYIDSYKKFKLMYTVDTTGEFKGKCKFKKFMS